MRLTFKTLAWQVASSLPARIVISEPKLVAPTRTANRADEPARTLQQATLPWCFDAQLW